MAVFGYGCYVEGHGFPYVQPYRIPPYLRLLETFFVRVQKNTCFKGEVMVLLT